MQQLQQSSAPALADLGTTGPEPGKDAYVAGIRQCLVTGHLMPEHAVSADLEKVAASTAKDGYVAFLQQYRTCLAEERIERLEGLWTKLDELWMRIKHWVQIVHDIEYGYGDPLRCKVCPGPGSHAGVCLGGGGMGVQRCILSQICDTIEP